MAPKPIKPTKASLPKSPVPAPMLPTAHADGSTTRPETPALEGREPLRSSAAFDARIATQRGGMGLPAQEISRTVQTALESLFRIQVALKKAAAPVAADITAQLSWLTPAGFLLTTPWEKLKDLPRYDCLLEAAREFPDLDPSATEVFLHLLRAGDEAFRVVESHLAQHEISQGRFGVLMALWGNCQRADCENEKPLTPAELAERREAGRGVPLPEPERRERRQGDGRLRVRGRAAVRRAGPFSAAYRLAADLDMWGRLALEGDVAFVPERLLRYRVHPSGGTAGTTLVTYAEECREVGRRHFPDGSGAVVVVGPARAVASALGRFGPVTVSPARRVL